VTWSQTYFLFGQGLVISAILAALPIFTLLFLLGVMRKPAWIAALSGLGVTFVLATLGYHMPVITAVSAVAEGAAFGLFPISWIVFWAIALFRVTVETGKFEIIRNSIGRLTPDPRLQALLIAFAFGAFIEGAAGFGTPVAIASTMLTGLGFSAFSASAICLLANTAPVAFGSIGIPVITLGITTGLPLDKLSAAIGRICSPVALIMPAYLIVAMWGFKALSGIWLPVITGGAVFAIVQWLVSSYIGPQLTDILASLASITALIIVFKFWRPRAAVPFTSDLHTAVPEGAEDEIAPKVFVEESAEKTYSTGEILYAWLPYVLLVICVLLWGWKPVQHALDSLSIAFPWPLLHDVVRRMPPIVAKPSPYHAIYNLNWFAASGTSCMVATVLTAICFRMSPSRFFRLLISVVHQLALPTVTVASVLAVAYLMNYCGATATLGLAFATTGALFPFFSSTLGWLGVFLTGSDTSANALFGNLQVVTAGRLGLDPVIMAATNSSGGVMGKMISLQTIAVAAAATGISVRGQSRLFRFTLKHSILLVCLVGCISLLYVYGFAR
jgi:L-lactate transport